MSASIKKVIVCLLAVFSLGAVASASASAAVCHAPDGDETERAVCLEGGAELESPNKLEGTSTESMLTATVLGVKVKIVCKKDKFVDTPGVLDDESTGTVTFEECKVAEPKNCKLPAAQETKIVANFKNVLGPVSGSARNVIFTGSGAGEEFTSITLENNGAENCAIKNTYKITGNTGSGCTFDTEIETFKETHELGCIATGEKLKLGGNAASFTTTAKIKTSTAQNWSIRQS